MEFQRTATWQERIKLLRDEQGENGEPVSLVEMGARLTAYAEAHGFDAVAWQTVQRWCDNPAGGANIVQVRLVADYWGVTLDWLVGRPGAERHALWVPATAPTSAPSAAKAPLPRRKGTRASQPRKRGAQ